jgi:hypothetical protein
MLDKQLPMQMLVWWGMDSVNLNLVWMPTRLYAIGENGKMGKRPYPGRMGMDTAVFQRVYLSGKRMRTFAGASC